MSSYCFPGILSTVHTLLNVMLKTATHVGMCNSKCLERPSELQLNLAYVPSLSTHHLLEALPDTLFKITTPTPFILLYNASPI